ncbi:DinB family protein [Lacibacter luteus]|uniref:DinB family protein n=1 Tax=Lacibacter luteus TaxID=2508719 RepID=A0A4Q1CJM7_9BACT|nr:DinB family protein [Lacibacter luteus]RXK60783.1 DinB family protein [Lacibacter luteus]
MLLTTLRQLFQRDLTRLYNEIEQYKSNDVLWVTDGHIANSAGNLCLHLAGNLKTYIGAELGNYPYIRNREEEFAKKDMSKESLLMLVQETKEIIDNTLSVLPDSVLAEEYPLLVFAEKTSTGFFLVHLATHLSYHLGQISYHRRLLAV